MAKIRNPMEAITVVLAATPYDFDEGLTPTMLAITIDRYGFGDKIIVSPDPPDADVIAAFAHGVATQASAYNMVVLADIRSGQHTSSFVADEDRARWLEVDSVFAAHGCQLIEWFIVSDENILGASSLANVSSRWHLIIPWKGSHT